MSAKRAQSKKPARKKSGQSGEFGVHVARMHSDGTVMSSNVISMSHGHELMLDRDSGLRLRRVRSEVRVVQGSKTLKSMRPVQELSKPLLFANDSQFITLGTDGTIYRIEIHDTEENALVACRRWELDRPRKKEAPMVGDPQERDCAQPHTANATCGETKLH